MPARNPFGGFFIFNQTKTKTEKDLSMDELEFIAMLQSEENGAVGFFNSEVAADQEKALRYYHGEPFGNEEEGHSTVISRDVASTVDGIMPDLIRVFVSGDNVVEFNPSKEGDEAYAAQATDYINHIFFKDNDGFSITHDWAKDGLLNKIGVVKAYWEETLDQRRETYEGLTENALISLSQEAEIIEATLDDQTGLSDVTVIRSQDKGRVRIENIPPEEFLVQPNTRALIDADYVAHKSQKSLSDLVEMGFDKDLIDNLPAGEESETTFDPRASERYKDEDIFGSSESLDQSMRKVWVLEEYVRCDYDGDGIAELRKVTRVNDEIFENIPVNEHPFVDFTPIKLPHKIFGKSIADDTIDIQLIKSTLLRQSMDNLYMTNNPRIEVPDAIVGEDTFDDILTVRPGAPIRTKGAGGLNAITLPFTAGQSFQMLEYWDGEKEQRTGVTRYNQGLDANSLNKTAAGIQMIQNKGMGKIELIARNLANSFGQLFRKILRLVIRYQDNERIIRLRGQWVPMQPDAWNADMNVREQVGLGTGNRNQRVQSRMMLLDLQKQAAQMGLAEPEQLYNNVSRMVREMELGDAGQYFLDPKSIPPKQPEPQVPKPMNAKEQAEILLKTQKMQQDVQIEREKMEMSALLKREQMQAEFALKREEMQMELALKASGNPASIANIQMGGEIG